MNTKGDVNLPARWSVGKSRERGQAKEPEGGGNRNTAEIAIAIQRRSTRQRSMERQVAVATSGG